MINNSEKTLFTNIYNQSETLGHYMQEHNNNLDNCIIIMAGGMGTRLRPLTEKCPKPMLKVGGRPILETILVNLLNQGFNNFYFAINYKANMIINYFQDGSRWNANIQYLHEKYRLGTAGALSILGFRPSSPIVVMNGDILTTIDIRSFLDFHYSSKSLATMCVKEYEHEFPYGVVGTENNRITSLVEKPTYNYLINTGIYILHPDVLNLVPKDTYYDMTSVFRMLLLNNKSAMVYHTDDYWLDIGSLEDYKRANIEYREILGHV